MEKLRLREGNVRAQGQLENHALNSLSPESRASALTAQSTLGLILFLVLQHCERPGTEGKSRVRSTLEADYPLSAGLSG